MTQERMQVVVRHPWVGRAVLLLLGAAAGATTNEAMRPPVIERERVVLAPCQKSEVICRHEVKWPKPLTVNINGVAHEVKP